MQTSIHTDLKDLLQVREADAILRSCVHCGFCTATCPTYQITGDELDGPRGRIYLIKNLLEENVIDRKPLAHLDRCLTCRSCETTCPSGVQYGRLLDIAKELPATRVNRPVTQALISHLLRFVVPRPGIFLPLLRLGQFLKPVLPAFLAEKVPGAKALLPVNPGSHEKRVILLQGCVQRAATPNVNRAITILLDQQNMAVEYLASEGCCGALDYHLSGHKTGKQRMRRLIDQLYPRLDDIEAIVSSASGCGLTLKDYPDILKGDPSETKARAVAGKVRDISELLVDKPINCGTNEVIRAALHIPCSLQHGQNLNGVIEKILKNTGIELLPVINGHLCCGSAGTYSIMQPEMSRQLRDQKLGLLQEYQPDVILTANIGCQLHLQTGTNTPVMHWTELLHQLSQPGTGGSPPGSST